MQIRVLRRVVTRSAGVTAEILQDTDYFFLCFCFFLFSENTLKKKKKKLSCPHEKSVEIPPPIPLQEGVTSPVCPSCGPPATRVQENAGV